MNKVPTSVNQQVDEILANAVRRRVKVNWRSALRSFTGEHRSKHKGTGNDFDTFRPMERGDDRRRMSAKIYGQTRERWVRVDRPETQIPSYVMIDIERTMEFGSRRVTKRELAAELAASCILSLNKSHDRVGTILFTRDKVEQVIPPKNADMEAAYLAVYAGLTAKKLPPKPTTGTRKVRGLAQGLLGQIRKSRSLVFLISDFQDYTEEDWQVLKTAAGLHDIVCLQISDEREQSLPIPQYSRWFGWLQRWFPTRYPLEDASGRVRYIWNTPDNRELFKRNWNRFEAEVQAKLEAASCRRLAICTKEGSAAFPGLIMTFGGAR